MTVEQALKIKQSWTPIQARNDLERLLLTGERPADKVVGMAVKALEKQVPMKPIIKYHKEAIIPQKYGRLIEFHCPNCGRFIIAMYETDVERGGGIHEDLRGCSTCLQAIDFTGYYHIDKIVEEMSINYESSKNDMQRKDEGK